MCSFNVFYLYLCNHQSWRNVCYPLWKKRYLFIEKLGGGLVLKTLLFHTMNLKKFRLLLVKFVIFVFKCNFYKNYIKPLESPTSTPVVCFRWVFCERFNFAQLLFKASFDIINTFYSVQHQSKPTFLFRCIIAFQKRQISGAPSSSPGVDKRYASTEFFVGNSIQRNFGLNHFAI